MAYGSQKRSAFRFKGYAPISDTFDTRPLAWPVPGTEILGRGGVVARPSENPARKLSRN